MQRAMWAVFITLGWLTAIGSSAWAIERELAGVRLGDRALLLLDKPGYGQPDFIGPLGTVGLPGAEQPTRQAAGATTRGTGRSGPSGPTGAGMGARGGAMRGPMGGGAMSGGGGMRGPMGGGAMGMRRGNSPFSARPEQPSPTLSLTGMGMMGGGRGGPMGGGAGGMRGGIGRSGMRGGMGGAGMRGGASGAARGGGRQAQTRGGVSAGTTRAQVATQGMYWFYKRPGGIVIVMSLDPIGKVTGITLAGNRPYAAGRTTKNIGLTSTYMEIIGRYGYPDQALALGDALELTYIDHGVRFRLEGMRVTEIAIGPQVTAGITPAAPVEETAPPLGLSVEELRGYL